MSKAITFQNESLAKHRDLANSIRTNLNREGGAIVEKESHSAYNANLPEGVTPEIVKTISKYNSVFSKASSIAVVEEAADAFQADKALQQVTAVVGYNAAGDAIKFTVDRQREFPVPRKAGESTDTPQKKVTKHLHVDRTYEIGGQSIKSVTSVMSEEFKNRFAS